LQDRKQDIRVEFDIISDYFDAGHHSQRSIMKVILGGRGGDSPQRFQKIYGWYGDASSISYNF
jgi:hypothetical protein